MKLMLTGKCAKEWRECLEQLLRDYDWAHIKPVEVNQDTLRQYAADIAKAKAKLKGFLLSAISCGLISKEELDAIQMVMGMIELRDKFDACIIKLREYLP